MSEGMAKMGRIDRLDSEALITEARAVAKRAYAPYSGFGVGAVVVATDGSTFAGANVENAAFHSTLCAEAVAMGAAVSAGVRSLEAVVVVADANTPCPPCGNCRQIMSELGVKWVLVQSDDGTDKTIELSALLPMAFGPVSLGSSVRPSETAEHRDPRTPSATAGVTVVLRGNRTTGEPVTLTGEPHDRLGIV